MLTPQEVSERHFQKVSFGSGYNMAQVDEFLDEVTRDYSALFNENTVLKGKMKVLVDKVEEYRSTEEAMRKALMTAQKMADDMVREAEEKKANIIRDAEADAADKIGQLRQSVEAEEYRLTKARESTAAFAAKVRALQAEEEELLSRLDQLAPPPAGTDRVAEAVSEIDENVQRLLAQAIQGAAEDLAAQDGQAEDQEAPSDDTFVYIPVDDPDGEEEQPGDGDQTSRIDLSTLQFGDNYKRF